MDSVNAFENVIFKIILGFAGTWNKSWISVDTSEGRSLKYTEELYSTVEIDLKKIKNLTLVKDVKNLAAPLSHNLPILVLDCPDRSLYLQSSAEKAGFQSTWST